MVLLITGVMMHRSARHDADRVAEKGREVRFIPDLVTTERDHGLGIFVIRKAAGPAAEQIVEMGSEVSALSRMSPWWLKVRVADEMTLLAREEHKLADDDLIVLSCAAAEMVLAKRAGAAIAANAQNTLITCILTPRLPCKKYERPLRRWRQAQPLPIAATCMRYSSQRIS